MSSSTVHLRPGIEVGNYPEREDERDSWLDRTAANITGLVRQYIVGRNPRYMKFVNKVNAQSKDLDKLDNGELKARGRILRRSLYSEGLKDDLVSQAFALIREISTRQIGLRHHDVQLYGGWVMLNGMIAEMGTGEGKTLAATLPACTAAMAGIPTHIVTVNDFLVARDAKWMGPIYKALGLTVGVVKEGMSHEQKQAAYACDITYCTNKQLAFDYLRDRMLLGSESRRLHLQLEGLHNDRPKTSLLLLRGLCFAIIDEADSVLVDEARTPLIISNKGESSDHDRVYNDAVRIARKLQSPRDYNIGIKEHSAELTDLGRAYVARHSKNLGGIWSGVRRRDELMRQALSALYLHEIDKHYLVTDGKIQIIDEYTGRVMADRSWERGLHQMVEAKESCEISMRQETLARISYQKFFRRYLRIAGMTGTAREVANELWSVYNINVVTIPTNKPSNRQAEEDKVFLTADEKWRAVVQRVRSLHNQKRPILIGTRSVIASEHLSYLLYMSGLPHKVLNARQDQEESEIIMQAGQSGRITVATNMAGRGTDIKLSQDALDSGGLFVLATERNETKRIDRQLFGRCGRQGDPGNYQAIISLEDELTKEFYGAFCNKILKRWYGDDKYLPVQLGNFLIWIAQTSSDYHFSRMRRDLLKADDYLDDMLAYTGRGE